MKKYWLVKTESDCYSINDLKKDKEALWTEVRNYQARNYLKDMKLGDLVLIYHSVEDPTGIAGVAKVVREAQPDPTQFDSKLEYFDPKATKENPRWYAPLLRFEKTFEPFLTRESLKEYKELNKMVLFQKGSRLSVQPVTKDEFQFIINL